MKFSDIFTEKDGITLDLKRVVIIPISILSPPALQIVALFRGAAFDVQAFCLGLAAVVTACAALLGLHAAAGGENQ